ncbi:MULTISPECIES: hypothetical protein [Halopseudomonas]|jgi:hypothetical protein|uniref:Uncharacterized protein n=1 Tax=Halopseudomonas aestusnigri TaxID=857252 RepID=A0AAQ1G8Q5_9GAMM|nr:MULTISPECIES: hypothetical protein [Halopseudomonas]MAH00195.1 hypothetical protein [Pseudomonadales bacterium]MEE2798566.1 hypothetical protein [Pseudomonadota bacterium]HBT55528.1 hypothetical protein [Pseudomonas sp.]MAK73827.1 hypothetical protein [Pseudomonadales bacterium]MAP77845.1 hypothetical protein [Pseudomonadales bacterium]|tara:strand:+ start:5593 stop:5835 length:243 start_codon:yes stop_codon:yes gene_type:complete
MPSPFLEIVELANGKVALRRSDEEGEPLVVIEFSRDAREYLQESYIEVAKAMISAGMQAAGQMMDEDDDGDAIPESRVLH